MKDYNPKLVCFSCNFSWGYLNDRQKLEGTIKNWIPVACSGKVDTAHVMRAFKQGADGVVILGCPEGECHFQDGNYQARKKIILLKQVLNSYGVEPERLKVHFSVDPEGKKIADLVLEAAEDIKKYGPVKIHNSVVG